MNGPQPSTGRYLGALLGLAMLMAAVFVLALIV